MKVCNDGNFPFADLKRVPTHRIAIIFDNNLIVLIRTIIRHLTSQNIVPEICSRLPVTLSWYLFCIHNVSARDFNVILGLMVMVFF